ncbi:MAG: GTPase HflX [Euryarchaeota archaeon]|nr:GTPase HflX [Euryarchaeota archaeon]
MKKKKVRTVAILTLDENLSEMEELAYSAGMNVVFEIIQRRRRPHPTSFVGKGKLQDIKETLDIRNIDILLINGVLKPSQHYLLENELKVECMDRIRLVLEIFDARASSREARLQVQRARLMYEIPLLREWVHKSKSGEHPGFLGGGAYEVDSYYELIRRQLARIESDLEKIENNRDLRRKRRTRVGFSTIALSGYTNAGKSSLLNLITSEKVLVEDKVFSTLSTTTSRIEGCNKQLLITDTIGFISNLPHFMIESFKSTLDEIFFADLVLLLIDSSDDEKTFTEKLITSLNILFPDIDITNIIIVLTKIDKVDDLINKKTIIQSYIPNATIIGVSSYTREGIDDLLEIIIDYFAYPIEMSFFLPHSSMAESLLSWLYDNTDIIVNRTPEGTKVNLHCRESDHSNIVRYITEAGGYPN